MINAYEPNWQLIPWSSIWRVLTPAAQTVFLALVSRCAQEDTSGVFFSYIEARQKLGLDRSTFHRAVITLETLEFIEVSRGRFRGQPSYYHPVHTWEKWGLDRFKVRGRHVSDLARNRPRSERNGRFSAVQGATNSQGRGPVFSPRHDLDRVFGG